MQVQSGKLTIDDYLERLRQGIKHDSLLAVTLNKRVRDSLRSSLACAVHWSIAHRVCTLAGLHRGIAITRLRFCGA